MERLNAGTIDLQYLTTSHKLFFGRRLGCVSPSFISLCPNRPDTLPVRASSTLTNSPQNLKNRRPQNKDGDFYVNHKCIDCDVCRWMAPKTFQRIDGQAAVYNQPESAEERTAALQALLSCPVGSIRTEKPPTDILQVQLTMPLSIDEKSLPGVYHCGYHSGKSYGATSYLIKHPKGNILVDSPSYKEKLACKIESLGGARYMFLTHRDDVADHDKWARRLGCDRILHMDEFCRFKVRGCYSGIRARGKIKMSSMDSAILKKLEEMETKIRQLEEEKRASEIPVRAYERRRKREAKQTVDLEEEEGESSPMQEDEEEYEPEPTPKKSKKDWKILQKVRQFRNMKIPDFDGTTMGTSFRVWVQSHTADVETKLEGQGPWSLGPDVDLIFTPGHTEGCVSLFYKPLKALFTGDHLAASQNGELSYFEKYNWYSVEKQLESIRALLPLEFLWILPGHGRRIKFENVNEKNAAIEKLLSGGIYLN